MKRRNFIKALGATTAVATFGSKRAQADAKKYKWKSDWFKNSQSAYGAAKKNGWFKEAISHMF